MAPRKRILPVVPEAKPKPSAWTKAKTIGAVRAAPSGPDPDISTRIASLTGAPLPGDDNDPDFRNRPLVPHSWTKPAEDWMDQRSLDQSPTSARVWGFGSGALEAARHYTSLAGLVGLASQGHQAVTMYPNAAARMAGTQQFREESRGVGGSIGEAGQRFANRYPRVAAHSQLKLGEPPIASPEAAGYAGIPQGKVEKRVPIVFTPKGRTASMQDPGTADYIMGHEAGHVAQALGNSDMNSLYRDASGAIGYTDNPFEVSARQMGERQRYVRMGKTRMDEGSGYNVTRELKELSRHSWAEKHQLLADEMKRQGLSLDISYGNPEAGRPHTIRMRKLGTEPTPENYVSIESMHPDVQQQIRELATISDRDRKALAGDVPKAARAAIRERLKAREERVPEQRPKPGKEEIIIPQPQRDRGAKQGWNRTDPGPMPVKPAASLLDTLMPAQGADSGQGFIANRINQTQADIMHPHAQAYIEQQYQQNNPIFKQLEAQGMFRGDRTTGVRGTHALPRSPNEMHKQELQAEQRWDGTERRKGTGRLAAGTSERRMMELLRQYANARR